MILLYVLTAIVLVIGGYLLGAVTTEERCGKYERAASQRYVQRIESERDRSQELAIEVMNLKLEVDGLRSHATFCESDRDDVISQRNLINARYHETLRRLIAIRESLEDVS